MSWCSARYTGNKIEKIIFNSVWDMRPFISTAVLGGITVMRTPQALKGICYSAGRKTIQLRCGSTAPHGKDVPSKACRAGLVADGLFPLSCFVPSVIL